MLSVVKERLFSAAQRACAFCYAKDLTRGTVIFKRMYPPRLYKQKQTGPFRPRLKRREFVYIMEENTDNRPAGNTDVILAVDVEGFGFAGDIVTVSKRLARNHMLPVGVAEYVSPENLAKYEKIRKERETERRQSLTAYKTMKQMQLMLLPIPMSPSVPWILNKTHVKVAFRICGVELTEESITLPDDPVTEVKEIIIHVMINGLHQVPVRALLYHHSKAIVPQLPQVWSDSPAAKFNVYEVISAAAHRLRGLTFELSDSVKSMPVAGSIVDLVAANSAVSKQPEAVV